MAEKQQENGSNRASVALVAAFFAALVTVIGDLPENGDSWVPVLDRAGFTFAVAFLFAFLFGQGDEDEKKQKAAQKAEKTKQRAAKRKQQLDDIRERLRERTQTALKGKAK